MNKHKNQRDKYVTLEEYKAILNAARVNMDHYTMLMLAGNAGLRVGEVVRLKAEHVKEKEGYILIPTLKQERKGRIGRGDMPETLIETPVSADVLDILRRYLKYYKRKSGWVFPYKDGIHWPTWYAQRVFKHYAHLAGLSERYSIHSLRHFRGMYLYKEIGDIRGVQELLRHKSITSTMVYTTMDIDTKKRLITKVEAVR